MFIESHVFRGDQRIDNFRRNVIVGYFCAILDIVSAKHHTVSAVHLRGYLVSDVAEFFATGSFIPDNHGKDNQTQKRRTDDGNPHSCLPMSSKILVKRSEFCPKVL